MIDIEKIVSDYLIFRNSYDTYKICKDELHNFYMQHSLEIEKYIDEYYENANDKEKVIELFNQHPTLKVYISLQITTSHYKEKKNAYSISSEFKKLGKCVICRKSVKEFIIVDLDNNINYCFETNDSKVVKYIEIGLTKERKFAGNISYDEISVVKVIYQDITSKNQKLSDKKICEKIMAELTNARNFDQSLISFGDSYVPVEVFKIMLKQKEADLKKLLMNNKITGEEYFRKLCCLQIVTGNITKMYESATPEEKEAIIDAYIELSTNQSKEKGKIHIRTASKIINQEVLKRRNKNDT